MKTPKPGTAAEGATVAEQAPPPALREHVGHRSYVPATKTYYVVLLLTAAVSLWLRKGILVHVPHGTILDDQLFLRMTHHLRAGDWLGPYDQLTLAKGMVYSLFIRGVSFAAVPLKIAEQAAYLAASVLTAELVRHRASSNYLAVALFGLLAFNPVLWNVELARVIREGLYISLSLAVVALSVLIAFPTQDGDHYGRRIFQGFSLGLVGGAFWLTREEGIWILPALMVVVAVALIAIVRPNWTPQSERVVFSRSSNRLKAIALPLAVAVTVFLAIDGLVAEMNYSHYGVFETNEFRAKSFLHAYGALTRIQHDVWRRYIPFPRDARLRAYSVSPAARELAPFLEGFLGESWRREGCKRVDIAPCSEVPSGWFVWELRAAVALAGHYGSAVDTMRFYDRLASEIDAGCASGSIDCLPPRATMSPPFRWEYLAEAVRSGKAITKVALRMGDGQVGVVPSLGSPQEVRDVANVVGGDVYPSSALVIHGWAASISMPPTIRLDAHGPPPSFASIGYLPAEDVLAAYPGFKGMRFQLETDCPVDTCDLVVAEPGGQPDRFPMAQLTPGARF
jgi:hypothetical protein